MFWNHQKKHFIIYTCITLDVFVKSFIYSEYIIIIVNQYKYNLHIYCTLEGKLILLFMEFIIIWKSDESIRVFSV